MTLIKKHRRYKYVVALLFFILVVVCANSSYAYDVGKIARIQSFSVDDSKGTIITDLRNGKFHVAYPMKKLLGVPFATEFYMVDTDEKEYFGEVDNNQEECGAYRIKASEDLRPCEIAGTFSNIENVNISKFYIEVLGESNDVIYAVEGRAPLKATLIESELGVYDTLMLKSPYSEEDVDKVVVESGQNITVVLSGDGTIHPLEEYTIHLKLESYPDGTKQLNDVIKINYEVGRESFKGEITIAFEQPRSECIRTDCPAPPSCNTTQLAIDLDIAQRNATQLATDLDISQNNTTQLATNLEIAQNNTTQLAIDLDIAQRNATQLATDLDISQNNTTQLATDLDIAQKNVTQLAKENQEFQEESNVARNSFCIQRPKSPRCRKQE
jgi:hypothetical protein